jgi:hypothetical protein
MKGDRCRKVISKMIPDIDSIVRVPSGRIIAYVSRETREKVFLSKGLVRALGDFIPRVKNAK